MPVLDENNTTVIGILTQGDIIRTMAQG
ncbi:hypothetical protein [Crocosphaera watsonii]|nr:hypothetical protein [Crocosphaera watsonii]